MYSGSENVAISDKLRPNLLLKSEQVPTRKTATRWYRGKERIDITSIVNTTNFQLGRQSSLQMISQDFAVASLLVMSFEQRGLAQIPFAVSI